MDVMEKLVEICFHEFCEVAGDSPCGCDGCPYGEYGSENSECYEAYKKNKLEELEKSGVTVQALDGCEYCKEDNDGYRKMNGAFSITNPFHGSAWNIETRHCKPRQIYFCPMCGRKLSQPPK